MIYSLPALGKDALPLPHFPTRQQAFLFRAYEFFSAEEIAALLGTTADTVRRAAADMGLSEAPVRDLWRERGYITIIRQMWHLLPYDQLLELLGMDEQTLAVILREEDFLDVKLKEKPRCERIVWRELTEEEREKTQEIRRIMETVDLSGRAPFDFEYSVPQVPQTGEARFDTRLIYAFSGLYQHAFDVDSEWYLPDTQLEAYRRLGINGIWTQGVLTKLARFPLDPSVSEGYETRLARMKALSERLEKYGIKLYLYLNEPRSMPLGFFEAHPALRGHVRNGDACLCTSQEEVQNYLRDAIEQICRAVPKIGGFFTITRSENMTNCFSHSGEPSRPCSCPRCAARGMEVVIPEVLSCFLEGAHRVSRDIKVFAWSWGWKDRSEGIIRRLPKDVILLSQSELHIPFEIGGVRGKVVDYSMSIVGPGERAEREWQIARECGLEVGAKVQVNTTWEASTVPAIPVAPSVKRHIRALGDRGVRHLLLSWTLGGYPSENLVAAAECFFKNDAADGAESPAEEQFAEAFREFPFDIGVLYSGPQNAGPSTLLYGDGTGYTATMTCFAYDDLKSWRSIYPEQVFEDQFARLCEKWEVGLAMLNAERDGEKAVMAEAAYCLFRSSLNQIRFVRARDAGHTQELVPILQSELEIARKMLSLMNRNAAIGYEAANHYYFSKMQLAEKILNCHDLIARFSGA